MIYLHPASSTSPERIQAVQATTGLTAIINTANQVVLQSPLSSSSCQHTVALYIHRTAPACTCPHADRQDSPS